MRNKIRRVRHRGNILSARPTKPKLTRAPFSGAPDEFLIWHDLQGIKVRVVEFPAPTPPKEGANNNKKASAGSRCTWYPLHERQAFSRKFHVCILPLLSRAQSRLRTPNATCSPKNIRSGWQRLCHTSPHPQRSPGKPVGLFGAVFPTGICKTTDQCSATAVLGYPVVS